MPHEKLHLKSTNLLQFLSVLFSLHALPRVSVGDIFNVTKELQSFPYCFLVIVDAAVKELFIGRAFIVISGVLEKVVIRDIVP